MPTVEQILLGLREIANNWRPLAILWHVYFVAIAMVLIMGIRPSIDSVLFLGAVMTLIVAFAGNRPGHTTKSPASS